MANSIERPQLDAETFAHLFDQVSELEEKITGGESMSPDLADKRIDYQASVSGLFDYVANNALVLDMTALHHNDGYISGVKLSSPGFEKLHGNRGSRMLANAVLLAILIRAENEDGDPSNHHKISAERFQLARYVAGNVPSYSPYHGGSGDLKFRPDTERGGTILARVSTYNQEVGLDGLQSFLTNLGMLVTDKPLGWGYRARISETV